MKTKLTVLLLAVMLLPVFQANSQQLIHSGCIGTDETEFAHQIRPTSDGGFIIVGYTKTPFGMNSDTNHGGKDVYVAKLNSEGNLIWQKNFGGARNDVAYGVAETPNHDYIVVATSFSANWDVTDHIGSPDSSDIWLLSLNSAGNITWTKSFGTSGNESAVDIAVSNGNRLIISGNYERPTNNGHQSDYWLAQLDFNGNVLWDEFYGGEGNEYLQTMLWTADENIYLGGSSYSFGSTEFDGETYLVKVDQYGDIDWDLNLGSSSNNGTGSISDICINEDEVITISRVTALQPDEFSCGPHGSFQYSRITTDGEIIDNWCYGGEGTDHSQSACSDNNGHYWLTGTTTSTDGDVSPPNGYTDNESNMWICKTDEDGNPLWNASIGGSRTDDAVAMHIMDDGKIILIANTNSYDGEIFGQHDDSGFTFDIWYVVIDPVITAAEEIKTKPSFLFYPNPANEALNITLPDWNKNMTYQIHDMNGHAVCNGQLLSKQNQIELDALAPGIYNVQVSEGAKGVLGSGRFIKM